MVNYLDFERPIVEVEEKLKELKTYYPHREREIRRLEKRLSKLKTEIFSNLSAWQIAQVARHPQRPYTLDYISRILDDFIELHGDRTFRDDPSIVGGLGKLDGESVMVIGHQKGRSTKEKVFRNFGMPHPEGYRKALRLMKLAERFAMPVITLIDTPGAYPGIGAEERGQAEAIARNLEAMSLLRIPMVSVVIGEGGSGGALAIGMGDRVLMLEYAIYSVISPEGCAAILWKDGTKAELAAEALKMTAKDLLHFGIIDGIVKEPPGGAHRDHDEAARLLKEALKESLDALRGVSGEELIQKRYQKYRSMGRFIDTHGSDTLRDS